MGGRGASSGIIIKIGKTYNTVYNGKKTSMEVTNIEKNGNVTGKINIQGLPETFRSMTKEQFIKRFKQ